MSGPETQAGRALLDDWYPGDGDGLDPIERADMATDILAIEAESATRALTDLRERVEAKWDEREDAPWGPDEFWVDSEPYVRGAAVLALIDDAIAAQEGAS